MAIPTCATIRKGFLSQYDRDRQRHSRHDANNRYLYLSKFFHFLSPYSMLTVCWSGKAIISSSRRSDTANRESVTTQGLWFALIDRPQHCSETFQAIWIGA